jgi:hypothetical protein
MDPTLRPAAPALGDLREAVRPGDRRSVDAAGQAPENPISPPTGIRSGPTAAPQSSAPENYNRERERADQELEKYDTI